MEVRVRVIGKDEEQIPQYSDEVCAQEEPKQEMLLLWLFTKAHEKKFIGAGLLSSVHVWNSV